MKNWIVLIGLLVAVIWWTADDTIVVSDGDVEFSYVVEYAGDAGRGDSLPMLVALHGNGDDPDHFHETALDQVSARARIVLFEAPISYGGGYAWPSDEANMQRIGSALSEAVGRLAADYETLGKPVLMGFSGGGGMAYYQAAAYGETYSEIVPVSGWLSASHVSSNKVSSEVVIRAFHGTSDRVVGIAGSRKAVELLGKHNRNVSLHEFDEGHLGVFRTMKPEISRVLNEALSNAR